MKCPNCSSSMYLFDQNASDRSLVKFYRCSNCVGEHVSSEPLNSEGLQSQESDLFASNSPLQQRQIQMV